MYCQKCRSPLRLDGSLEDLNLAAFDLLVGATSKPSSQQGGAKSVKSSYPQDRKELYDRALKHAQSPVFKRSIPPPRHGQALGAGFPRGARDNPAMSFVMLTESQLGPTQITPYQEEDSPRGNRRQNKSHPRILDSSQQSISQQVESTTRLFEILSSRSDVDHPICVECTELLVDGLQKRLAITTKERDAYIDFLRKVNSEVPTDEEVCKTQEELEAATKSEAEAFEQLLALEKEKAALDDELADLEEESRQLDIDEENFWRDRNDFSLTLTEFQNERDAINMKYDYDSRQLERLQRTNVYNDTFCIGYDGYFGTINGLRLGRLNTPPVEWAEINAAWGQALLLLHTVANKLDYKFEGYRLRPMGSTSRIEKIEFPQSGSGNAATQPSHAPAPKSTMLDLYSSGDLPLGQIFLHRRFNAGTCAFLDCLRQLGEFVERESGQATGGPGLKLPYEIKKDRIGDVSIKLGFNQDESWTRACKYALTCCKFLLAHASNVAGSVRRNGT
ncbi:MAG: autophagy protein 6 [Cirrosporium novae-zelandiae]|nr:MAG: autophagy protein 6 [Cirrosporium novae-zelandiae]